MLLFLRQVLYFLHLGCLYFNVLQDHGFVHWFVRWFVHWFNRCNLVRQFPFLFFSNIGFFCSFFLLRQYLSSFCIGISLSSFLYRYRYLRSLFFLHRYNDNYLSSKSPSNKTTIIYLLNFPSTVFVGGWIGGWVYTFTHTYIRTCVIR